MEKSADEVAIDEVVVDEFLMEYQNDYQLDTVNNYNPNIKD